MENQVIIVTFSTWDQDFTYASLKITVVELHYFWVSIDLNLPSRIWLFQAPLTLSRLIGLQRWQYQCFLLFLFSIRYQISDDACVFGVKISIHLQRGYKAWRRGFCSFCILSYNSHTYWKSHNSKLLEACILHRVPRITVINSYLWHFVAKNWLVPGAVFIPKLLCNVT